MKPLQFSRNGLSFAILVLLAACGGEVSNSGGAGGMNPTGGGTQQSCLDFCHKLETSNCMTQLGECTEYCGTVFGQIGPECADEGDAVFSCWLPSASMCLNEPPAECQSKVDAMEACQDMYGCGPTECGCSQTCAMTERTTACTQDANGISCECSVNGAMVGTCQGTELECGIEESCCAMFFTM